MQVALNRNAVESREQSLSAGIPGITPGRLIGCPFSGHEIPVL